MIQTNCHQCKKEIHLFPSRFKKAKTHFCGKSCHRTYKNLLSNPLAGKDRSGKNNPMWGRHPIAWNLGRMGEKSHNWKGGLKKRKDGYFRINVNGVRYLYHRYLLKDKIKATDIIHHKDHNPSNNSLDNLMVFSSQSEHVRYERLN